MKQLNKCLVRSNLLDAGMIPTLKEKNMVLHGGKPVISYTGFWKRLTADRNKKYFIIHLMYHFWCIGKGKLKKLITSVDNFVNGFSSSEFLKLCTSIQNYSVLPIFFH